MTVLKITFKQGLDTVAEVKGVISVDLRYTQAQEDFQQIIPTEHLLERLTGLRVHIEQAQ